VMQTSLNSPRCQIVAIVVTHNRLAKLRDTVARLLAEDLDGLLVFDNASTDDTWNWLDNLEDTRVHCLRSPLNLGGAGGFAHAMAAALDRFDADWLLLTDDDGRPVSGALTAFRAADLTGWDAVGAAVFHPDDTICEMNRPYRNPFWRLPEFLRTMSGRGRRGFHLTDAAYAPDAPPVEVDMTSFVGFFISREATERVGLPDERLFIYGDDQLYTLTMRRLGMSIAFLPQVRFEHDTEAIQGVTGVVLRPLWKVYYMYRNALISYRVAAGPFFWPLVPLLVAKWRRKERDYGEDAPVFRRLLSLALRDGMARRLDRGHAEIMAHAVSAPTASDDA
jgi:rhamnopyranosyl-N-acetylglucosaminyl-diphospho-decaprenol beta-1,3/1,4-galactofuranosyltransferase